MKRPISAFTHRDKSRDISTQFLHYETPNAREGPLEPRSAPVTRPGTAKAKYGRDRSSGVKQRSITARKRPSETAWTEEATPAQDTDPMRRPEWNNRFFIDGDEDEDLLNGTSLPGAYALYATSKSHTARRSRPTSAVRLNDMHSARKVAESMINAPIQTHPLLGAPRGSGKYPNVSLAPSSRSSSRPVSAKKRPKSTTRASTRRTKQNPDPSKSNISSRTLTPSPIPPPLNLPPSLSSFTFDSARSSILKSATISARSARAPHDTSASIAHSYQQTIAHIRRLWEETQVRYTERLDFETNYFLKHPTHEAMEIVFAYEQDLLYYKEMTIRILRLIEMRENHIQALHRYVKADQEGTLQGYSQLNAQLKLILSKIRFATLDIVENVVEWRSIMTYPKPFFFDKQNYLLKVQRDLDFFVKSRLALHVSDLHQPFDEFTGGEGTLGISPPRLKRYQKQFLMNTLPSLNVQRGVDPKSEEWMAFRDRVYRAFHVLAEEANRAEEQGLSPARSRSPLLSPLHLSSSPHQNDGSSSNSSRRSSISHQYQLQLNAMGMRDNLCQITFVSHFQSNEKNQYSTLLEPATARTSRHTRPVPQQPHDEDELITMHKAATKLQSVFKGWLTRNTLKNEMRFKGRYVKRPLDSETTKLMKEALRSNTINDDDFQKIDRVTDVQSWMRARVTVEQTQKSIAILSSSSVYIQSWIRTWHAILQTNRRRNERDLQRLIMMQSQIRMLNERRQFVQQYTLMRGHVLTMQRSFRTHQAVKRILWELEVAFKAASVIQRSARAWLARVRFSRSLAVHRAAIIVQKAARVYVAKERVEQQRTCYHVTLVQCGIRSILTQHIAQNLAEHVRLESIIRTQSHIRERLAILSFQRAIEDAMLEADALLNDPFFSSLEDTTRQVRYDPLTACLIIQRAWRCYRARCVLNAKLTAFETKLLEELAEEQVMDRLRRFGRGGMPLHVQVIHLDRGIYGGIRADVRKVK